MDLFFSVPKVLQNGAMHSVIVAFVGYLVRFLSARMPVRRRDKLNW